MANAPIYAHRNSVVVQDTDHILVVDDVGGPECPVAVPSDDRALRPDSPALVLPHADGAEDGPDHAGTTYCWTDNATEGGCPNHPAGRDRILPSLQSADFPFMEDEEVF
jgi:hypothetical protein